MMKRVCQKSQQYAPKGQKPIALGNTLGNKSPKTMRPARAKALIINAFAPAGRFAIFNPYTQGAALGYVLFGLSARFVCLLTHPRIAFQASLSCPRDLSSEPQFFCDVNNFLTEFLHFS